MYDKNRQVRGDRHSIRNRKMQKYYKKRKKMRQRMCGLLSFVLFFIILCITGESQKVEAATTIYIETKNVEMYQDAACPIFQTIITIEGDEELLLDEDYTIAMLVKDLQAGEGLETECEICSSYVDGEDIIDGEYVIDTHLTEEYQNKLLNEWRGIVNIQIVDGNLQVYNNKGYWKENVFMSWEDKPLSNQLITTQGNTYYLDENGEKVLDDQVQIGMMKYTFDAEGKMIDSEYYVDPEKPMIALTFDDGPGEYTAELLEALESYGVRATFFVQGANIQDSDQAVLEKIVELGCELGNHSTTHADLSGLSIEAIEEEMLVTDEKIYQLTGVYPTVMRPPYGAVDEEVKVAVSYPIILWNVDTLDWKTKDSNDVLQHTIQEASDGDIILMHDTKSWSVEAAIEAIPLLLEQGYQLVTVSELAEARGMNLQDGFVYFSFPE